MTLTAHQPVVPRALRTYLAVLSGAALVLLVEVAVLAAGQPWTPLVVPVTVLVCTASRCFVWASDRSRDPQSFNVSDIGFVVAVVLLPLPLAVLVAVLAGLVAVLVDFWRAPERLVFNCAGVVLQAVAAGGVVRLLDPTGP